MFQFTSPVPCTYKPHDPQSHADVYLEKNRNNILAEFFLFVQQNSSNPTVFDVSLSNPINGRNFISRARKAPSVSTGMDRDKEKDIELIELHYHFGVFQGNYCVLSIIEGGNLLVMEGSDSQKTHYFNDAEPKGEWFYDYGFIGDAINEHKACVKLSESEPSPMLIAIADPRKRETAEYLILDQEQISGGIIPINDGQFDVLNCLSKSIEGIQGPPGSGKSTVIAHIVSSCLPDGDVTLATCVQNKAVDAIAEKLGSLPTGLLPFFVTGNVTRLGIQAIKWTLECQVERDPRIIALHKCRSRYSKIYILFKDFLDSKLSLLNRLHLQRRREKLADIRFKELPSQSSTEKDIQRSMKEKFVVRELWYRCWTSYIKSKYATYVRAMKYNETLRNIASKEYSNMLIFVRAELIDTARVVLCTTATASGSLAGNEEFRPAFSKLKTIILDEAGTVPETKLPLLLTLNPDGIERIIAIGDQKQLAPFTYVQSGGPQKGTDVCWEFTRTGRCKNRGSCRYEHTKTSFEQTGEPMGFFQRLEKALPDGSVPTLTEQYRMHPTVCKLVANLFYDGLLSTPRFIEDARTAIDPHGLWWLTYPDNDAESTPERSKSKQNIAEAVLVVKLLINGLKHGRSVMAITFYKAQENLIRRIFKDLEYTEDENCRILTVDQSQGSEADEVILSGVRCNKSNDIGFVKNPNRMNVAISRMKERLTVVGSHGTLCTNVNWSKLFQASKVVSDINDIPLLPPSPQLLKGGIIPQSCSIDRIKACPTIEKELQRKSDTSYSESRAYSGRGRGGGRGGGNFRRMGY